MSLPEWLADHVRRTEPAPPANPYEVQTSEVRARDLDRLLNHIRTPFTFTGTLAASGRSYSRHLTPAPGERIELGLVPGDKLLLTYTDGSNPELITVI